MSDLAISTPHDLLNAVPFLLGFHPSTSVVVISIRGESRRVGLTIRLDYPEADADLSQIADRLVDHLIDDGAEGALVVIYRDGVVDHRRDELIDALALMLDEHGLLLHDALLVSDGRWWSLIDTDTPIVGTPVPDFSSSFVAAEHVLHGAALPLEDEGAVRATLASHPSELADLLRRACANRRDAVNRETILEGDGNRMRTIRRRHIQQGADAVDRIFVRWLESPSIATLEFEDVAVMLIGMQDVHVRDYAMGIHDDHQVEIALALWRSLLPITPEGSIAPLATVLAAVAFESGDGVLAQRAIDRAFDDRQGYPMAALLRQAIEAGWAPSAMTAMRKDLRAAVVATVRAA
jgi:hypothetical protein